MRTACHLAPGSSDRLRVAIVHYWLMRHGGGERVVAALAKIFPQADIFAVVAEKGAERHVPGHHVTTSFLQRIPGSVRYHRHFLPLYPFALEQFDLRGYDVVISSDSGPAKGVLTSPGTLHISYCHSPMRSLWDSYHASVHGRDMGRLSKLAFAAVAHYMRMWDVAAAARVDEFIANSSNVAARIRKTYRREATVIYPPVDIESAYLAKSQSDYYLAAGRLVDYKRFDLAIEACKRLDRPLRIVGDGPQLARLRKLAGKNSPIDFLGTVSDAGLWEQYAHCRALLFPGEEDFGIVPVEAQACGRPVIAHARGGALETVIGIDPREDEPPRSPTGIFFHEQTAESLARAILTYEDRENEFRPGAIRRHAARFSAANFERQMRGFIDEKRNHLKPDQPATAKGLRHSVMLGK